MSQLLSTNQKTNIIHVKGISKKTNFIKIILLHNNFLYNLIEIQESLVKKSISCK